MSPEESMRTKQAASDAAGEGALGNWAKVASVAAAVAGWAIGMYAGFDLLWPLLGTAAVWVLGKRFFGRRRQQIVPAFSVQAGHWIWFVVGLAMVRQFDLHMVDVAWLALGLAWLWIKPGKAPLCFLAVYQLLSLPHNVVLFSQADFGTAANKTLLVHIVWRCLALFYMARLYYRMNRHRHES